MTIKRKLWALALTVTMSLGLLTGCGDTQEAASPTVRVGLSALPVSADPALGTGAEGQTVLLHLYEGLMKKAADAKGAVVAVPGVAKSYSEEENEDGSVTLTFRLRDNARWSDERAVVAEDFVYAWQRLVDPTVDSPNHELLRMVKGYNSVRAGGALEKLAVSAKNETTLVVVLSYRCPYFISEVCASVATAPLRRDIVSAAGWDTTWSSLVTNGAYEAQTLQGETLTADRSAQYYDKKTPGPTQLLFTAGDTAENWARFSAGELDAVTSLPEEQLAAQAKNATWHPLSAAGRTYSVVFNNAVAPLVDATVRQALSLAIDRSALPALLGLGTTAATGLVPAGVMESEAGDFRSVGGTLLTADAQAYAESCRQAAELLAKSSYSGGTTFPALEYLYVVDPQTTAVAQALRTMWREALGVEVTLRAVTAAELDTALLRGEFSLAAVELGSPVNDAMGYLDRWVSGGEDNPADYSNSAFNTLVEVIRSASDETARLGLLHDAEQLLLEDAAVAPLYVAGGDWKMRTELTGGFRDALGRLYLSGVSVDINV